MSSATSLRGPQSPSELDLDGDAPASVLEDGPASGSVWTLTQAGREPLHNLPLQPAPLIGRQREREAAKQLLLSDGVRLLSLTGPAGVGKTRLAAAVAEDALPGYPDGVWFVDLATIREPDLVIPSIAHTLGIGDVEGMTSFTRLQTYLSDRQMLLVLDCFEHVLQAACSVASLLASCPELNILVTSRTRLRLRWEHMLSVSPLPYRDPASDSVDSAGRIPAVALLLERARASQPDFTLTSDNLGSVLAVCEHLEGLPLAIELAAVRANSLTPSQMLSWVEHRLSALSWEAQDLPERHQTLRKALHWSYALLGPAEQALFRRLGVFAGGWTIEAAGAICQTDELDLAPQLGLASLVDASLIQVNGCDGDDTRFALLNTLRELAREQLADSGELVETLYRHTAYYAALAEQASAAIRADSDPCIWQDRLNRERENLRAALEWSAATGETDLEVRVASVLATLAQSEMATRLPSPELPRHTRHRGLLSPREEEVLRLVSEGLTNKQIADRLIISVATVNYHVTSVLTKLSAENRTQAVSLATQRGII